jgi:hypothetical protein
VISVQGFLEAPTALRIARESNDHAGLNRGLILITIPSAATLADMTDIADSQPQAAAGAVGLARHCPVPLVIVPLSRPV